MDADGLDFLWLELTNRCNLRCVHCYTDSHPGSGDRDLLTTGAYESLLRQAYELGCRRVQFIGGEPQLHPDLLRLLGTAKETGFEFVEVFSNLTRLRGDTLSFAAEAGIHFATSVYSDDAPEELTGCEPLEPCEPEDRPSAGGTVGCDVVDVSGPAPPPACPQSGPPPTTQPECPQSPEPCPQSPA